MTDWEAEREALVHRLTERRDVDESTTDALLSVPRQAFVPAGQRDGAYRDTPLPIGEGQTISAPHMVAIMTDLLDAAPGDDVLEVGTGRGYHAAVTAEVAGPDHVSTVEYHEALAEAARQALSETGYDDISVRHGDGKAGCPAHAPYDRAYLTCAASEFPDAVVDQVRPGGILLAPIGGRRQRLIRGEKLSDGTLETSDHGGVRFVPLQ